MVTGEVFKTALVLGLGNKSTIMTQRYAHHCTESLRDCIQVLESDYNLTTVGEKRNVL